MKEILIEKFAETIVKMGANVKPNQIIQVNSPIEASTLTKYIVKYAYMCGASDVIVNYSDSEARKMEYLYAPIEELKKVKDYELNKLHYLVDHKATRINITSPNPDIMKDLNPDIMHEIQKATAPQIKFFRETYMENVACWTIAAYPNKTWAKKVFPNLDEDEAYEKLFEAILKATRIEENSDPIAAWQKLNNDLTKRNEILNELNLKELHFKNNLGTDLTIGLVENHIWAGGGEYSSEKNFFNPNMPTEENFCMPHNKKINGTVVSTKPLFYQGKLIENFSLTFKDGRVISYHAQKEEETLGKLLDSDFGSRSLGEVALVPYDSPISKMNILFYNTLFDENASCHLALGASYRSTNLKNASNMTDEQLEEVGSNDSIIHEDFMFGSSCMNIDGVKHDGSIVPIFRNGNFVI